MNLNFCFKTRHVVRRIFAIAAIAVCGSVTAAGTEFDKNLIVNGNAEASAGATDYNTTNAPVGWQTTSNFTAVRYDAPSSGGVTAATAANIGGGTNFFAGGPSNSSSSATQIINISDLAQQIDAGNIYGVVAGSFGGRGSEDDYAELKAELLDVNGTATASFLVGQVLASERSSQSTLMPRNRTRLISAGTRSIRVTAAAGRFAGDYNDGYADNLSFKLVKDAITVKVPGSANPFLAAANNGTSAGCDTAPGLPPYIVTPPNVPGLVTHPDAQEPFYFSASGATEHTGGTPAADGTPDGNAFFSVGPSLGISGCTYPLDSLVGVFLDDRMPSPSDTAPPSLDFSASGNVAGGTNYTELSPAIRQIFFIGDGFTSGGVNQKIIAPPGATRLFLASTDGCGWSNNNGAFTVLASKKPIAPAASRVDLRLSLNAKTDIAPNGTNVIAGEIITYTLTVYNAGTKPAQNVVVIDRLPNHTKFISGSNGAHLNSDGLVEYDLGTLQPSGPAAAKQLTLQARVAKDTPIGSTIVNGTTGVYADGVETAAGRDKPETFVKSPVEVELSSDATTVAPGGVITYTFNVRNVQPKLAPNVRVSVPLPAGTQFVSAGPGGTLNAGTVFFTLGDLPADASRKVQLTVQLPYDSERQKAIVLGPVQVSTGTGATLFVFRLPDAVTQVSVNQAPAPQLSLTKFLPDGTIIGQYFLAASLGADHGLLDSFKKVFPAIQADQDLYTLGQIVNPELSDSTDKTGNSFPAVVAPGQQNGPESVSLTFALVYNNSGDTRADNVFIQDRIPEGLRFVQGSAKRDGFPINSNVVAVQDAGRTLHFSLGSVPRGVHLITYRAAVLPRSSTGGLAVGDFIRVRGSYIGTSSLTHTSPATPEETDVKLIRPANAIIESYKLQPNGAVGDNVDYDIFYQNTGDVTSTDLRIVDPIPAGTSFRGAGLLDENHNVRGIDPSRGESAIGQPAIGSTSGTVTFHLGRVAPGEFGFVRLSVKVLNSAGAPNDFSYENHPGIVAASFAQSAAATTATDAPAILAAAISRSRTLVPNAPRIGVVMSAPMAVQEGEKFDYLIALCNPTSNFLDGAGLAVRIPAGAEVVSAEAVDQPNVRIDLHGSDDGQPAVRFFSSGPGFIVRVPPHGTLLRKVTFRAPAGSKEKTFTSIASTTGSTGNSTIAPAFSERVSSYVYPADQGFEEARPQIVASSLANDGLDVALLRENGKFQKTVEALLPNAACTKTGGLDTVNLNNGAVLIPLGNNQVVVTGLGKFFDTKKLITNDGGSLVASGAGNLVAQGGGNLISVKNLISNDGGGLIGNDGASIASVLSTLVAQGGGNLVAQGGGNLVASGAGNLVLSRPGAVSALISNDGGGLMPIDASKLFGTSGGKLVASGAGNLVAQGGGNLVAQGGGNLVASGAGNLIAQGGGNLLVSGGGSLATQAALAISSDVTSAAMLTSAGLVAQGGGNLVAQGGGN